MGISKENETYQIRELDSHDSTNWTNNFQMGTHGPGERFTKKQTTSRPDYLWPEIWKDMSEAAQRKEKQKWAIETPKLDNAGKLRCAEIVGSSDASSNALQDQRKNVQRKLVALLMLARQDTHASLKPTNLRESVRKELLTKIMKTIL